MIVINWTEDFASVELKAGKKYYSGCSNGRKSKMIKFLKAVINSIKKARSNGLPKQIHS